MKFFIAQLLIFPALLTLAQPGATNSKWPDSPLAEYSKDWNDPKYLKCNTAAGANYLSNEEKKTIYILNLARMNPALFANTVVSQYPDRTEWSVKRSGSYYKSLLATMKKMKPLTILTPDSLCFRSAYCHALTTGKAGTVTHDRTTPDCRKQQYFGGECCQYGNNEALEILMSLLIDEDIPSLGHREILLGNYTMIGVSIQPHILYKHTAVLDLK